MKTELEIIYGIHEIVRGGQYNQDDPINERLLRAFLRIHRGKHLARNYKNGKNMPIEVYQDLGPIPFSLQSEVYLSPALPKTIRFENYFGLIADIDTYPIAIVPPGEFRNNQKHRFNKYQPMLQYVNNKLELYPGLIQPNDFNDDSQSELNIIVRKLAKSFTQKQVSVNVKAVLVNPDDEAGYNFRKSPYPFPDELTEDLINSVNAREFNIFLRARTDDVGDMKNDAKDDQEKREI